MRKISYQMVRIFTVFLFAVCPLLFPRQAHALPLTSRSVIIGNSAPSATTTHNFGFTLSSVSIVGSIELEYCSNSPITGDSCTAPAGFSTTSAVLQSQTGETGFIINPASSANRIVLSRPPTPAAAIPVTYNFSNITNQNAPNSTVYVRIATYASNDATGPRTDEGAVAFATVSNISVAGYVPPYLTFCTGVTVALNCSSTNGSFLNFGELSSSQARYLSSQFSVATNDPGGYSTTVNGPTMTSGNNLISSLSTPRSSQPGTSQFGMNLRANSNPPVGSDPSGVGTGAISGGFNNPNQFYFNNQVVAQSTSSSDFNAFTVSYLVNINRGQRPGVYSTTLTYIASAAF